MAKYLDKTFGMEGRMKIVGMSRRWSTSRGWPGTGRMGLKQTEEGGWMSMTFQRAYMPESEVVGEGLLMERVGSLPHIEKRTKKRRVESALKGLTDD